MSNLPAVRESIGEAIESILIGGDLAKLTADERVSYYRALCESVGLNPLTKPFEFITLNGKLTLYARKDATDQLRANNQVSITIAAREVVEGCYVVTARAILPSGRTDESIGAVPIENLKGENRSNALMKCETKAKRRVTLSICGMGLLDETEVESIPGAKIGETSVKVTERPITFGAPKDATGAVATAGGPAPSSESASNLAEGPDSKATPTFSQESSEFIDVGMQANFAARFRNSLQKEHQKEAERIRHDWLGRHGFIDADGNPSSKRIPTKDFEGIKADACAWARKFRG